MRQFTLATSVALLLVGAGASPSFARGGKKDADSTAVPSSINQQFQWEDKVVGPKEGLDKDKVAATRERGIREEQERKARGPEKVKRVVAEPSTASIPTQDIEKPAAPVEAVRRERLRFYGLAVLERINQLIQTCRSAGVLFASLDPDAVLVMPATAPPEPRPPRNGVDTAPLLQG